MAARVCISYPELQSSSSDRHIRLIELRPASEGSQLACVLFSVPFSEAPKYEALSYCWGVKEPKQFVNIYDQAGSSLGQLIIQPNLHAALSQLRLPDEHRLLWADAICINQDDLRERSNHVPYMRDIFARACRVLGWLGGASSMTPVALAFIDRIACAFHGLNKAGLQDHLGMPGVLPPHLNPTQLENVLKTDIDAALDLFDNNQFFSRAWIVQEVVFSKETTIIIGEFSVEWSKLGLASAWISSHLGMPGTIVRGPGFQHNAIGNAAWIWRHERSGESSAVMLLHTIMAGWKSTDPRDMVYAFLGFEAMQRDISTMPDYTVSTENVYINTFRSHVEKTGTLQFLRIIHHRPEVEGLDGKLHPPDGFPSWLPDLRRGVYARVPQEKFLIDPVRLLGMPSAQLCEGSWTQKMLSVQGLPAGRVTITSDVLVSGTTVKEPTYRSLLSFIQDASVQQGVGKIAPELWSSLAYAMTGGFGLDRQPVHRTLDSVKQHKQVLQAALMHLQLKFGRPGPLPPDIQIEDSAEAQRTRARVAAFLSIAELAMFNRRMFATTDGYIGIGSALTRPGDSILVLFGSHFPILSRELNDNICQIVGHAASYLVVEDKLSEWRQGALQEKIFTFS